MLGDVPRAGGLSGSRGAVEGHDVVAVQNRLSGEEAVGKEACLHERGFEAERDRLLMQDALSVESHWLSFGMSAPGEGAPSGRDRSRRWSATGGGLRRTWRSAGRWPLPRPGPR